MKQKGIGRGRFRRLATYRRRMLAIIAFVSLIGGCAMFLVARASIERAALPALSARPAGVGQQPIAQKPQSLASRLALQPEADRMRRRLGQRFLTGGREVMVMVGTLIVSGESQPIRITRTQSDDGEHVEITLGGRSNALSWDQRLGARSGGALVSQADRALVERLALDSVDQFILAQLRGASYYTVARCVRPAEAGDKDDYEGPVWDVIRIGEPAGSSVQSASRTYLVNSANGLLDKVISKDPSGELTAEISEWANRNGETT